MSVLMRRLMEAAIVNGKRTAFFDLERPDHPYTFEADARRTIPPISYPPFGMARLSDLVSAYLLKDIRSLVLEENVRAFNALLYLLAQNQGSVVSIASLAREIRLSEPTVARYLDLLEQTYVVFSLPSYARNIANELKKSRKYYLYDLGIRNVLLKDFSPLGARRSARGRMRARSRKVWRTAGYRWRTCL